MTAAEGPSGSVRGKIRTAEETRRLRQFLTIFTVVIGAYPVFRLATIFRTEADGSWNWSTGEALASFWALPVGKLFVVGTAVLLVGRFLYRRAGRDTFLLHAAQVMIGVVALNWMVAHYIPLAIKGIGSSYLIFFYHFPSALSCYAFFTLLMVCSVAYLVKDDPLWDRAGRTAGQLGLLACTITLTTGSTWASAAWNAWWVWDDPRLMTAAIMWLTYAGYVMLQAQLDDPVKRRRYCAVFGILAFLNIPIVHYAIQWFGGEVSHPMKFDEMSAPTIVFARWFGVFVFVTFYALVYRWRIAREGVRDRLSQGLWTIRRLEEGARG